MNRTTHSTLFGLSRVSMALVVAVGCSTEPAPTTGATTADATTLDGPADSPEASRDSASGDTLVSDTGSDGSTGDGAADDCPTFEPPCPSQCEAIVGRPLTNECFDALHPVEIACMRIWGTNGLTACVMNEATGEMYRLSTSTYLWELVERGGWKPCPEDWSYIPDCQ